MTNDADAENSNQDANMVSGYDENCDDSFVQVTFKVAKKLWIVHFQIIQDVPTVLDRYPSSSSCYACVAPRGVQEPYFRYPFWMNMLIVLTCFLCWRGDDGIDDLDGVGAPDPFNQSDDDQADQGEPNAPDAENPIADANMISEYEVNDDDAFFQVTFAVGEKRDGCDGFGVPDPFNQNDDDQVVQCQPNAPHVENPSQDPNMVSDNDEDGDDSSVQITSKVAKNGDGFDGLGAPEPFNQNGYLK